MGELYQNRTPKPLFDALQRLMQTDPSLVSRFRFEMIGEVHQLDLAAMGLNKLPEGLVLFRPRVGYSESCSLMASATGLMVIDAPVEQGDSSVFLPSKLIEYVGAGRPIVGLTPEGTAAKLIRRLGGWIADPADADELARVMREFLVYLWESRESDATWGNPDVRSEFQADSVAQAFKEIVHELT
jgi:glycosyltransferase involved in cell wall biosynthesis